MGKQYNKRRVIELSLDELREKANRDGETVPFEYQLGAYYEMDTATVGEIAHIKKLIDDGLLSPCEKKALQKKLADQVLDQAERKAYGRAVQKLKSKLLG